MAGPRARATTVGGIFPAGLDQRMLIWRGQNAPGSACYSLRVRSNENEFRETACLLHQLVACGDRHQQMNSADLVR
jgi:hypothetical protein